MLTSLSPFSKHPSQAVYEESTTVIPDINPWLALVAPPLHAPLRASMLR